MDLGTKRPGLLGGPVERTAHRPRFGASPSLLCTAGPAVKPIQLKSLSRVKEVELARFETSSEVVRTFWS